MSVSQTTGLDPEEADMMIAQVSQCAVQENKENYEVMLFLFFLFVIYCFLHYE